MTRITRIVLVGLIGLHLVGVPYAFSAEDVSLASNGDEIAPVPSPILAETITPYVPFVVYGSRIVPPPPTPWYKKPWIWALLVGLAAAGWEAYDDDPGASCAPSGSLTVTGPAL